jgi:mono/diheme cytochrome c family protein
LFGEFSSNISKGSDELFLNDEGNTMSDNGVCERTQQDSHCESLPAGLRHPAMVVFLSLVLLVLYTPGRATALDAEADFSRNCKSCHTIGGGRLVGPDLKDVLDRRDRDWLADFIVNPLEVMNSGDAYALKLREEAGGMVMPALPGMNKARAEALLGFIEARSGGGERRPTTAQVEERPFTKADFEGGKKIFLGAARMSNGGTACISCHSIKGMGVFSGGNLAPDLTDAYQRLGQRKGLAAWLSSPATLTMQSVFAKRPLTEGEIHQLTALLQESAGKASSSGNAKLAFLLAGAIGAVVLLVIFASIWRKRFRSVRQALFDTATSRG